MIGVRIYQETLLGFALTLTACNGPRRESGGVSVPLAVDRLDLVNVLAETVNHQGRSAIRVTERAERKPRRSLRSRKCAADSYRQRPQNTRPKRPNRAVDRPRDGRPLHRASRSRRPVREVGTSGVWVGAAVRAGANSSGRPCGRSRSREREGQSPGTR